MESKQFKKGEERERYIEKCKHCGSEKHESKEHKGSTHEVVKKHNEKHRAIAIKKAMEKMK